MLRVREAIHVIHAMMRRTVRLGAMDGERRPDKDITWVSFNYARCQVLKPRGGAFPLKPAEASIFVVMRQTNVAEEM